MSDMGINDVLAQMRALAAQAQGASSSAASSLTETNPSGFTSMIKDAVNNVNDIQHKSGDLQKAFETGDPRVSLAQVMIASQKSSVAFQATLQVRNKVIQAYKDIMNMPI